jgi:hypothetical protein
MNKALSYLRKPIIIWAMLVIYLILLSSCNTSPAVDGNSTLEIPSAPADKVEVVYFHRPQRCSGCVYAETGTRYTLENYFTSELAEGKIIFKVINLGDESNTTIVERYGAYTSSLFINSTRDDVEYIEEVTEIWFLLGKDDEFSDLVKSRIERHLSVEIP